MRQTTFTFAALDTVTSNLGVSGNARATTTAAGNVAGSATVNSGGRLTLGADMTLSGTLDLRDAGSTVVSDLIEPNLLGRKPQLGENARTTGRWSSNYKTRVLPDFVNIFDDPSLATLDGKPLFGNYALDDEGVKAQRVH